jgi:SAM-dependent methyltransferase
MFPEIHASLKAAYEDVAYVGRPNPWTDPDRLAAIGSLFGLAPPDPASARVLEVGCGDGANLLPMAARMSGARFTGCDYSALLMGRANEMRHGLGLANVELLEGDLRAVSDSLGKFDYIIAHGFYSWVPPDVRDAFLALASRHLAPGGLVFVSYNVLPGCFVRQIGWDAIRFENADASTAAARLGGARSIRRDLAEAWAGAGDMAGLLASELADDADRTDSALYHDDMSGVNQPVYFTTFVRHAGAHGLGYIAEAATGTMGAGGLPPELQSIVAAADPLSREQYIDFARLRRFRQSVLATARDVSRAQLAPQALDRLHFSAVTGVIQDRVATGTRPGADLLVDVLAEHYPGSIGGAELVEALVARGVPANEARGRLLRGCFAGACEVHVSPIPAAQRVPERPRAFGVARWQAARSDIVTNLRHEGVRVDEEDARQVLVAADGTRDHERIAAVLGPRPDAARIAGECLERFAFTGLLEA